MTMCSYKIITYLSWTALKMWTALVYLVVSKVTLIDTDDFKLSRYLLLLIFNVSLRL
jgi:hypothetical protein